MVRLFPAPRKSSPNRSNYIPSQTLAPQCVARQSKTFFLKKAARFAIYTYVHNRAPSLPLSPASDTLSAISFQLSAISYQLSAISFQLSAFSYQHSAFSIQHSAFSIPSPLPSKTQAPRPKTKSEKNPPKKPRFPAEFAIAIPPNTQKISKSASNTGRNNSPIVKNPLKTSTFRHPRKPA
jgi:hypothetical protein